MTTTITHTCADCGRNISYMYGEGEVPAPDAICVLCMVQGFCQGACEAHADEVAMFDTRILTRVWFVLEMVFGLVQSLDATSEIYEAGSKPLSGLDVDLSEHHLGSGTLDVLYAAGQEMMTALRRLAQTLVVTRDAHPGETWFAVNHHPAGALVIEEWDRVADHAAT